jgi:hypothetical protein
VTTPTATQGPCEAWAGVLCCTLPTGCPITSGQAMLAATEVLYKLSAQQFGLCTFTFRPCRHDCFGTGWPFDWGNWWQWGGLYPRPVLFDGAWFNLTCGNCPGTCSCRPLEEAWLPGPVASVISVKLDGATMPASGYRIDDFRKLVRVDGGSWPICQNLTAADTQPDTWSVTVQIGQTVPQMGLLAAGELACEIMNACCGNDCRLPRNATSVSRQGVTIDLPTITELLERGMLGLRFTDMFIAAYNPRRLQSAPQVFDVDGNSWRRVGT